MQAPVRVVEASGLSFNCISGAARCCKEAPEKLGVLLQAAEFPCEPDRICTAIDLKSPVLLQAGRIHFRESGFLADSPSIAGRRIFLTSGLGRKKRDLPFLASPYLISGAHMAIKPLLQGLWLVDDVNKDEGTGKVDVRGMFDCIEVKAPSREFTASAYLFCALRGVHGSLTLTFRYTDLDDGSILVDRSLPVLHDDPLTTLDVAILIRKIPVPHSGVYVWELICENRLFRE